VLVLHRNPGSHTRPQKRNPAKRTKVTGLSINELISKGPQVRANLVDEIVRLVAEEVEAQGCPSFHECKPYVRETYYFKDKRGRDHRNWGKQVIDALEVEDDADDKLKRKKPLKCGIILNDSDKHILLDRPRIVEGDPNPRIEVTLVDTRGMTADEVADLFRESAMEQIRRLIG
jgi:hypothetical protein